MLSRLPRWLLFTLIGIVLTLLVSGIVILTLSGTYWVRLTGWIIGGLLIGLVVVLASTVGPQLYKLYKFNKYFKTQEAQLRMLPTLMQTGRTQEALARFGEVMKHAPDNAYLQYMHAFFLNTGGKPQEALSAANKALTMVDRDPFLPAMLQQMGGQMGQPTTVADFKSQLYELKESLEPRVNQMRERREKAVSKRKKKSR